MINISREITLVNYMNTKDCHHGETCVCDSLRQLVFVAL